MTLRLIRGEHWGHDRVYQCEQCGGIVVRVHRLDAGGPVMGDYVTYAPATTCKCKWPEEKSP